jgi:hypothetical protein
MRSFKELRFCFIKQSVFVLLSMCCSVWSLAEDVIGKMDFIQIDEIPFSLHTDSRSNNYKSDVTRLWYAAFQADNDYTNKPIFVFINGGPGCGTCMNLFSMNTAPYTLDRNRIATNCTYAVNPYSWTTMGNLLYIDAPNAGFSYMMPRTDRFDEMNTSWLGEDYTIYLYHFLTGDNFHPFIDAAQVLRTVLVFLSENPEIQKNEVIFVGESYSGVRVTTMLNLILYHKGYADGTYVYQDKSLVAAVTNHFKTVFEHEPPFAPEEVAKQFSKQILIQPQILDAYQQADTGEILAKPNSALVKLGEDAGAEIPWEDYLAQNGGTYSFGIMTAYLDYIDRDPYNGLATADWSYENEYFSMLSLNDFDTLHTITGNCNPSNVAYLLPESREDALKFAAPQCALTNINVRFYIDLIGWVSPAAKAFIDMIPGWDKNVIDTVQNSLTSILGKVNDYDAYVIGTNPYVFIGFMMNNGGFWPWEIYDAIVHDPYGISMSQSDIYGKMFLKNLAVVDTFMTDAKYDFIVYSPTLVTQFQKDRFPALVQSVTSSQGDDARRRGSFSVQYQADAISELTNTPPERTVSWHYYSEAGHAVSSSQPEEFRADVAAWLQTNWYDVVPRIGNAEGGQEITIYGKSLCVDSNDLTSVTVLGSPATIQSASPSEIIVTTPVLPTGCGDVVVSSTTYGTITAENAFTAKSNQVITVASPTNGYVCAVGESVTCDVNVSSSLDCEICIMPGEAAEWEDDTTFRMLSLGVASVCFEQPGNDVYFAAPSITNSIVSISSNSVFYVSPEGDDSNHGLSWDHAKVTIQAAADIAISGSTIMVTNGIYATGQTEHQNSLNRVVLGEGVQLKSVNGPEITIIDGANTVRGIYMKVDSSLEGFTIRNGLLSGSQSATEWRKRSGAGVFASQRSKVSNCIIQSNNINIPNYNYARGAGICIENDVHVSRCYIADNIAMAYGDNEFGGGLSTAENATGCVIDNCVFIGNLSAYRGGGLFLENGTSAAILNCTFTRNEASSEGSAVYGYASSTGNTSFSLNNSIVYNNILSDDFYLQRIGDSDMGFTNSCAASFPGTGTTVNCITTDPEFEDQSAMLASDSPCINAGSNAITNSLRDVRGMPRVVEGTVDMGAYEYQSWVVMNENGGILLSDELPSRENGTAFGTLDYGVCLTNSLFVKNITTTTLSIEVGLSGENTNAFALGVSSPITVAPDTETKVPFILLPDTEGEKTAQIYFNDGILDYFAVNLSANVKGKSQLQGIKDISFEYDPDGDYPAPIALTLTNSGPSSCEWYVSGLPSWLEYTEKGGSLESNETKTIYALINTDDLEGGRYVSTNIFYASSADNIPQVALLEVGRKEAYAFFNNLTQTYDTTEKEVSVFVYPADLFVDVTYDGKTNLCVNAGNYAVTGVVDTVSYYATNMATFVINKAPQTIAFNQSGILDASTGLDLEASATSGLNVDFAIAEMTPSNAVNQAWITNSFELRFDVSESRIDLAVAASQEGNSNWLSAASVTNFFYVTAVQSFTNWATMIEDPEQRSATDCPAGDDIPNLLKYAIGLSPEQYYTSDALFSIQINTNCNGDLSFIMSYNASTKTENIHIEPIRTFALSASPTWSTNDIVNTNTFTVGVLECREASIPLYLTNSVYMKLKVIEE